MIAKLGGVVLNALLMELWQTLQLGWNGGLLERGYGGSNTIEPLLLVEHIIGLQSVFQDQLLDGDWLSVNLKSFGCQLVTTVAFVGIQAWQLKSDKRKQSMACPEDLGGELCPAGSQHIMGY
ncbi:hypothetical protein MC885_013237 [Smutsia gigantea]|nr:hypothetical protein MC885_013237 [Smutsia gigantea]